MNAPTREVFGNISPWMQALFYTMIFASLGVLAYRLALRARTWLKGQPGSGRNRRNASLRSLLTYALLQKRVLANSLGGVMHALLYSGFVVLAIGTTLLFIAHAGPVDFHFGWYYLFYELTMDVFGVAFCLGCGLAIYRRLFRRPASLGHDRRDWLLLGMLLAIGVSGFFLEALRLHYTQPDIRNARWSPVGRGVELAVFQGVAIDSARTAHLVVWWLHALLVAWFFAFIPFSRMLHAVTGPIHIAIRPSRPMGALEPVAVETVEETGRIGAIAIEHFRRHQLLSLDACMECGRCEQACPAWAAGKPLSPKAVVVDLRDLMTENLEMRSPRSSAAAGVADSVTGSRRLHGETIRAETLWSCTTCYACVEACPVLIGHVDLISDMRRNLVGEGKLTGPPATALRHLAGQANPYGQPAAERAKWTEGLNVPTVDSNPDFEYLLWVGCAAAFDPRARNVARATARLLVEAGVDFAILGEKETCTGDPARRVGDEFLFQELARSGIQTLNAHGVRKIITPCPHCFNTLKNEYPQFGGRYDVLHHAQFLAELIDAGRLKPGAAASESVTLHDPCYLARVNGELDAQRKLIGAAHQSGEKGDSGFREMPRHGRQTFCCGAGGGRMWFDESPDKRVSHQRAKEAIATGAKTLVTACPFCLNMMSDGMGAIDGGQDVKVLDVAEILADRRAGQHADR